MKSKSFIAIAVTGALVSLGAIANEFSSVSGPSAADETTPAMTTLTSLDTRTGGFKGWGPMPNPYTAASVDESNSLASIDKEREYKMHVAEVNAQREQVWVANAPLRAEYENIGATRSSGGGFGRFFSRH
jgi:hypothetical protein